MPEGWGHGRLLVLYRNNNVYRLDGFDGKAAVKGKSRYYLQHDVSHVAHGP